MLKMKQVCDDLDIPYETLRFYCNEGLVPHVKRDENNHRLFDQRDVDWLKGVQCLRACGLSIGELKEYLDLCLEGPTSILQRKAMLADKKMLLLKEIESIHESMSYIDNKQAYYDQILAGEISYSSNLIVIDK
ncbi:MAG: MerR family transcriptional regulator [Eubacteriales bacterium]|nr:MerR family transcriptional regulator [Eubacteriales bacterium]